MLQLPHASTLGAIQYTIVNRVHICYFGLIISNMHGVQHIKRGPRWRSWLRHCTTNRKVAGSIPNGVIGMFRWHNPFDRIMAWGRPSL
jgi:hypothetical protein